MLGRTRTNAHYEIKVPASFNAKLDTAGGDISARGLTGNIKADTSGGELTFDSIHGSVHADTSGGGHHGKRMRRKRSTSKQVADGSKPPAEAARCAGRRAAPGHRVEF